MTIKGSCHCGNTRFEVSAAPASVTRCTCSLCSKRGALWGYYMPAQFRLTTRIENVATYQWQSRTVKHHFCANCGCSTYSESPDWSTGKPDFDNPRMASIRGCWMISISTPCRWRSSTARICGDAGAGATASVAGAGSLVAVPNQGGRRNVGFGAHPGLKPDITQRSKSANRRHRAQTS